MTQKDRQAHHFAGPLEVSGELGTPGALAGGTVTPGTGAVVESDQLRAVRHLRLTLSGFAVSVAEADDFGGTKLCDLPDSNLALLGVEVDLELVKGEAAGGIIDTTDVNVAVGTAVASNATLSGAMVDVLSITALTATDASPAYQAHSAADGTLAYPIGLEDSATLALFLNAAAAITADDTITVSGTVDLYFVDLGNVTS